MGTRGAHDAAPCRPSRPAAMMNDEPRVADRLAVDAAEAVQAAVRSGIGGKVGRGPARRAGASGHRPLASTASRPYCGQERLLERRLAGDEVEQLVLGGGADDGRDRPATRIRSVWSSATRSLTPGQASERRRPGTGPANRSSTWWWARSRRLSTVPSLASRPSRMIATRSQAFSTSDRMCEREEHGRAVGDRLVQRLEERLLDERVEARRGLVEDEQLGPVLEGGDHADLLLVALAVLLEPLARVEVEALDQRLAW